MDSLTRYFLWSTNLNPQGSTSQAKLASRPDDGGVIEYYYHRPAGSRILVFVCTGKARVNDDAGLQSWIGFLEPASPCAVIIHNYPGRGQSSDRRYEDGSQISMEKQIFEDNQTLLGLMLEDNWAASQIVLIGNSIGNGPIVDMLCNAEQLFAHTILISPYKNLYSLSTILTIVNQLGSSEAAAFDSYSKLQKLVESDTKQRVSLISSDGDTTISSKNSEDIFKLRENWCTWYSLQKVSHKHTRPAAQDEICRILRNPETQLNTKVDITASPYHLMEVLVQVVRLRLIQTNMDFDGFVVSAVYFQILDLYQLCPMPLCTKESNFFMAEVAVFEKVDHTHAALVLL